MEHAGPPSLIEQCFLHRRATQLEEARLSPQVLQAMRHAAP